MVFAGGTRAVLADGSIQLTGAPRPPSALAAFLVLGLFIALPVFALRLADAATPFVVLAMLATFGAPLLTLLLARRTIVFDASSKAVRIQDRGVLKRSESLLPFAEIKALSFAQREPSTVANEPPTLVVNGRDLMTIKRVYANDGLELELKRLVNLPLLESPRDTRGWSGL